MIVHVRDRRLHRLHERDDARLLQPQLVRRIRRILDDLDQAESPADMDIPCRRLHPLRGNLDGMWAVWVSGNWRIIFRFDGRNVRDVELIDYH